jgi:hypothetical protein
MSHGGSANRAHRRGDGALERLWQRAAMHILGRVAPEPWNIIAD